MSASGEPISQKRVVTSKPKTRPARASSLSGAARSSGVSSFGKPSIAFNVGAHPELPVAGLANDNTEWTEYVRCLLDNPSKRQKYGAVARQQAAELGYNWVACVNQVESELLKFS